MAAQACRAKLAGKGQARSRDEAAHRHGGKLD
jgi:hypothetical protein